MNFVKVPNLPQNAGGVIVSPDIPAETKEALDTFGVDIIFAPRLADDINPIINHPDVGIVHINSKKFVCSLETYSYYKEIFYNTDINLVCGDTSINGKYPKDAAYNIAIVSNYTFLNEKNVDNVLLNNLRGKLVNIKQGYAKCSICVVDENSIITEDEGITAAAIANNIDVLKISKGQVELKGYDYGFIGGCSGKLSKNVLAFVGDISSHSDYDKIYSFCRDKGVEVVSLGTGNLIDIGSILPVYEKE